MQGGGGPAEPVLSKQSVLADDGKITAKGGEPAEVAERHPRLNPCGWTTVDIPGAERHPQSDPSGNLTKGVLDPSDCTTRKVGTKGVTQSSSRGANESERRGDPVTKVASSGGLPRSRWSLAMTFGFTMAEILLSLTIIGVVAAITLPSLTGNINERTWNTQRKALYARMSQAIALMPALNGFGTLIEGDSSTSAVDTAAETFITAGLSKVLKINNICDYEHLEDCGFVNKMITLNAITISTPTTLSELNNRMLVGNSRSDIVGTFSIINTNAAAFETANGESILTFYNPNCQASMNETKPYYVQPKVCANFIFDLNGNKGPNTVGKDIGFMTVFYPTDSSVVAPDVPVQKASQTATQQEALGLCKEQNPDFRIPSQDELSSMFVNQLLLNGEIATGAVNYWSSKLRSSTVGWTQGFNTGARLNHLRSLQTNVHCVKR